MGRLIQGDPHQKRCPLGHDALPTVITLAWLRRKEHGSADLKPSPGEDQGPISLGQGYDAAPAKAGVFLNDHQVDERNAGAFCLGS